MVQEPREPVVFYELVVSRIRRKGDKSWRLGKSVVLKTLEEKELVEVDEWVKEYVRMRGRG